MVIKVERLDRLINIQRKSRSQDEAGQEIESWTNLKSNVAASLSSIRGDERFTASQFVASEQVEFWIRWDPALADLSPLDRVIYPPYTPTDSPPEDPPLYMIYDIMASPEVGRQDAIKIQAARRSER